MLCNANPLNAPVDFRLYFSVTSVKYSSFELSVYIREASQEALLKQQTLNLLNSR